MISNIKEVKARGASVIAVINEDDAQTETVADYVIRIPRMRKHCNTVADNCAAAIVCILHCFTQRVRYR